MNELDIQIALLEKRDIKLAYREAASILLVNSRLQVLMGEVKGCVDIWKIPGGGIDKGEKKITAALRELNEEAGFLQITVVQKAKRFWSIEYPDHHSKYRRDGFRGQTMTWFMGISDKEISNEKLDEIIQSVPKKSPFSKLRWVDRDNVLSLAHNDKTGNVVSLQNQRMYQDVLTEFGLLQSETPFPAEIQRRIQPGLYRTPVL